MTPAAYPFPNCVIDGRWEPELLDEVIAEFPNPSDPRWVRFDNDHEVKLGSTSQMWGEATRTLLHERLEPLAGELSEAFGIPDLTMETIGGGMHLIPPGGKLDIHVDFNRSPNTSLYRRLNCLVFLNRDWDDEGGHLELWPEEDAEIWCDSHEMYEPQAPVVIAPEFNRTVIFETSDRSWHGHPQPASRYRASIAAYFYSPEPPPGYSEDHSTVWRQP